MLSPWSGKGHRGDKLTKEWCMLSPWAGKGHRGDKNDQKVMHVVTMSW